MGDRMPWGVGLVGVSAVVCPVRQGKYEDMRMVSSEEVPSRVTSPPVEGGTKVPAPLGHVSRGSRLELSSGYSESLPQPGGLKKHGGSIIILVTDAIRGHLPVQLEG